jgi:hypothetical protein
MRRPLDLLIPLLAAVTLAGWHGTGTTPRAGGPPDHAQGKGPPAHALEKGNGPPPHARAKEKGPPPHAPAHGYRRKHQAGVDLLFDSGLGAYKVVGKPDLYFHDDHFVRRDGDSWRVAKSPGGPWKSASEGFIPPGLRDKPHKKAKKHKHHGRGKGHAKQGRGHAETGSDL